MPMLNFQKQFAADVESGKKTQTIRKRRKNPIKPGDILYLYTGARTKACRKLGEAKCKSVENISIYTFSYLKNGVGCHASDGFAKKDGFDTWGDLLKFFIETHGLPFKGDLIKW